MKIGKKVRILIYDNLESAMRDTTIIKQILE
jgi:hypothetical protein